MKPTRGKRTTTQPGLGKVTAGRRTTLGEGQLVQTESGEMEPVPISAPAPSGSGQTARTTRALEKVTTGERLVTLPPEERERASSVDESLSPSPARAVEAPSSSGSSGTTERSRVGMHADPRSDDGEASGSGRVERVEARIGRHASDPRIPIDITTIDPKRMARGVTSKPASRPPQGRKSLDGFAAVETPTGRRASTPARSAPSTPPAVAPRVATKGPARSARVSIREDNLGNVQNVPDAVGVAGRAVPKLLKTKAEIAAAPIDHRAGFLLAHVDGVTSVAGLVDICGMPEEEVEQILERLRRLGIVAVR